MGFSHTDENGNCMHQAFAYAMDLSEAWCLDCGKSLVGTTAVMVVDRDPADETGYDLDDPKHPTYHDRMADYADA